MEVLLRPVTAIATILSVRSMMLLPSNVIQEMLLLDMESLDVLDMDSGINLYQHVKVGLIVWYSSFTYSNIMELIAQRFNNITHVSLELCIAPTLQYGQVSTISSLIEFEYYPIGASVSFTCVSGYEMEGSNFSTCLANSFLSTQPPTCT